MKIILLNELEYVEGILESGEVNIDKIYLFLGVYSRYLYHEKGLRKARIIKELDLFMNNHYPRYSKNDWIGFFEKYAASAKKYPLCKCNGVRITHKEIEFIKSIKDKVLEKLYFTLLCLVKFYNYKAQADNNWVNLKLTELFNIANVKLNSEQQATRLHELLVKGLIDLPKRVDSLKIKVINVDYDYKDDDLVVNDFQTLGNLWLMTKGEKYFACSECGKIIKRNNNSQKYCKQCAYVTHIRQSIKPRKTQCEKTTAN